MLQELELSIKNPLNSNGIQNFVNEQDTHEFNELSTSINSKLAVLNDRMNKVKSVIFQEKSDSHNGFKNESLLKDTLNSTTSLLATLQELKNCHSHSSMLGGMKHALQGKLLEIQNTLQQEKDQSQIIKSYMQ